MCETDTIVHISMLIVKEDLDFETKY